MTSQKLIDDLVKWVTDNIVPEHTFKVPPPADQEETGNYKHELAHPVVFPMYFPSIDDSDFVAPAILVQVFDGKRNLATGIGSITVRLVFQIWNPGLHDGKKLIRNADGWRDLDTIIETTLTKIAEQRILNGHEVHPDSVEFSYLKQDDAIVDLYPYYCGHITFTADLIKFVEPVFTETP